MAWSQVCSVLGVRCPVCRWAAGALWCQQCSGPTTSLQPLPTTPLALPAIECTWRRSSAYPLLTQHPTPPSLPTHAHQPHTGMAPGKGYVDVSTVDAATSASIAAAVRAAGGLYLEAPVSGSKGPAEQGALIFLTAGERERRVEGRIRWGRFPPFPL